MVLHRAEPGPAVCVGAVLSLGELPGIHGARADVPGLSGPDHVLECLHGLLDRRGPVPAVDLVQVHVVHVQAAEGGVDRRHDVLAGQAAVILTRPHRAIHLGCDDNLVTAEELAEQAAGRDLARSVGIDVCGIEERDAAVGRGLDDWLRGVLVKCPRPVAVVAVAHHPEANPRDPQAGLAQVHIPHSSPPGRRQHQHRTLPHSPSGRDARAAPASYSGRPGSGFAGCHWSCRRRCCGRRRWP